jgi:hypothetical protein
LVKKGHVRLTDVALAGFWIINQLLAGSGPEQRKEATDLPKYQGITGKLHMMLAFYNCAFVFWTQITVW